MKGFVLGLVVGLLALPLVVFAFFRFGSPPVAVADAPLPFEKQIVHIPLHARIARQMPHTVPIAANEATYAAGALVYRGHCAMCHGVPDQKAPIARSMFPSAPQLFVRHGDHVGVSDDQPGETYWVAANGIRLSGMPAFEHILSETQLWQVTLLLAHADQLPASVLQQLKP